MERRKVEFIESYIKIGNGDYQWNDNHGELIRCKDCKHGVERFDALEYKVIECHARSCWHCHSLDWYCADGERKRRFK